MLGCRNMWGIRRIYLLCSWTYLNPFTPWKVIAQAIKYKINTGGTFIQELSLSLSLCLHSWNKLNKLAGTQIYAFCFLWLSIESSECMSVTYIGSHRVEGLVALLSKMFVVITILLQFHITFSFSSLPKTKGFTKFGLLHLKNGQLWLISGCCLCIPCSSLSNAQQVGTQASLLNETSRISCLWQSWMVCGLGQVLRSQVREAWYP